MSFDESVVAECAAVWEAFEAEYADAEQRRIDDVRVRGYALATLRLAEQATKEMEKAGAALERARKHADRAQKAMERAMAEAEAVARVVVSGDREWISEVAERLEECFG